MFEFPLFSGPSDPLALRDYLNQLINFINEIVVPTVTNSLGRAVTVTSSAYNVSPLDGLVLVDCVAAGGDVQVNLLPLAQSLIPVAVKKIDQNTGYRIFVTPAGAEAIEYEGSGNPYLIENPGDVRTFDARSATQYWVT